MRAVGPALAVLLAWPGVAAAQTGTVFNRPGSGARAAGMANAFIAISDDGTAASWNPAGLGQLRKPEFSVVTTTSHQASSSEGFRTRDDMALFSPIAAAYTGSYIDFGSLAVPVTIATKPVTFQASWRRLYTLDFRENVQTLRTPVTPRGPPRMLLEGNSDTTGGFSLLSIAGAVKLTSRLAIGGSFNVWRADWDDAESASETLLDSDAPPRFESSQKHNRVRAHNLSVGILLTYPRWSIGLLRQGTAHGEFSGTGTGRSSRDPQPPPDSFTGDAQFPQSLGLGVAWRPVPRWTVAFDLTWDEWSRTFLDLEDGTRIDVFNGLPLEVAATRNTLSASAGAECLLHGEGFVIPIRFGAAWEPQGPRNPYTRDPVNFMMLAAGTGYNTNSLKFDAAFQYRWTSFRNAADFGLDPGNPLLPGAVGESASREWRVKLSVIVRLVDTERLHRTLRKVFGGA